MKNVVITEDIHPDAVSLLAAQDNVQTLYLGGDSSQLIEALPKAHAILVRTMRLRESELKLAANLEVISRHGVGCDNLDVDYLSEKRIPVAIAVDSNTTSVVEHTLMMMLSLSKRAMTYDHVTRQARWSERGVHKTSELAGKKMLIVGFGRIGKRVAAVCRAFDMNVTVADIALDRDHAKQLGCRAVDDFHTELSDADYLSVHVPLDETTRHLIGQSELDQLPAHAIVINCARGGIVDEHAISQAVLANTIAAFGSDVFSEEPVTHDNPLLKLPNSLFTPHSAAATNESMRRMAMYAAQNILDYFDGALTDERVFNAAQLNS